MEQKTKIIIMGLAGILAISLFINLQTQSSKQAVQRERDNLRKDNESLAARIEETIKDSRRFEEKVNALNTDLERASQEKDELQRKIDSVAKERDGLTDRLREKDQLIDKLRAQPTPQVQIREVEKTVSTQGVAEDAYWAGILKSKTDLEFQLENMRSQLKSAQISSDQFQREKGVLELELSNLGREKQDLEQQIEYSQKTLDSVTSELIREKNAKRQLQDSLRFVKNENTILRRQLKTLGSHKASLETKLEQLQKEKTGIERKFSEMELLLEDKFSQISDLKQKIDIISSGGEISASQPALAPKKESVELPPIVVHPQAGASLQRAVPNRSGSVLAINKDYNFAIVDLGEDEGIRVGQTLQVYRADRAIAAIEVVQVRKSISACDIKKQVDSIVIGDIVR